MDALKISDDAAAAVAVAPRVTLEALEAKIAAEYCFVVGEVLKDVPAHSALDVFTVCIIVMKNGFVVTGESAPASPANFNRDLGHKLAREQAVRKAWGFEGYALREQLAKAA